MTIVASWGRDFPGLGVSAQRLAARINEVSEGRIKTTYYAAGEKVGAFDVFDDVASGNSQAFISAAYYWKGKHPGFAYFCAVPFGMTTIEWNAWIKFQGWPGTLGRAEWGVRFEITARRCNRYSDGWLVSTRKSIPPMISKV